MILIWVLLIRGQPISLLTRTFAIGQVYIEYTVHNYTKLISSDPMVKLHNIVSYEAQSTILAHLYNEKMNSDWFLSMQFYYNSCIRYLFTDIAQYIA